MKDILVYRESLLPISETFIQNQVDQLTRYRAFYGGLWRSHPSLALHHEAAVLNETTGLLSSLRLALYERAGFAPAFLTRLRSWNVQLIHAHFALDGIKAVPLAMRLRVPLLVTLHGYDVTIAGALRNDFRELWRTASCFLCVSEFIRERALQAGFPEEKLLVHYIGVDAKAFQPAADDPSARSGVLFVGRLVEKKGAALLLRAMQQVQQSVPDAVLTLVGDGPLRVELEELARALGVRCRFAGAQNQTEIRQHMQQASVFCVPSVTASSGDCEGFGIVFIEAQAMGTPVVSFRHGGIPEAVLDGVTGQLVPERDVPALTGALLYYLQNEQARLIAGKAGQQMVRERYDLRSQTQLLESIYDSVLNDSVLNAGALPNAG